jgi:MFS transporter, DHA2 family, multidrug resistance protein
LPTRSARLPLARDCLPQQKTAEGSALINVAAISAAASAYRSPTPNCCSCSQFHQALLAENIVPPLPTYQSIAKQITEFFAHTGPPANAAGRAMDYIGHLIESQAAALAYIDIFYSWAIFAACLIPLVLLLVRRGRGEATAMH